MVSCVHHTHLLSPGAALVSSPSERYNHCGDLSEQVWISPLQNPVSSPWLRVRPMRTRAGPGPRGGHSPQPPAYSPWAPSQTPRAHPPNSSSLPSPQVYISETNVGTEDAENTGHDVKATPGNGTWKAPWLPGALTDTETQFVCTGTVNLLRRQGRNVHVALTLL